MKKYYFWGSFLIIFFFLRGGEFFLSNFNSNLAYIFDQLGLAVIGVVMGTIWLSKKSHFRLGKVVSLVIILFVVLAHYSSFYRVFWFDELRNIIGPLGTFHGYQGNLADKLPARPNQSWEKYGWSYGTLVYELVGIDRPYSLVFWSASGILLLVAASLSTAWLAGIVSKSQMAALVAGLLVGIPPNSFTSLLWITNIQTDGLGVLMVTLTVGIWFVARKTKDAKGIFIALLLLAATLKGGSVVRTATTGGILMLTDVIFFRNMIKKGIWVDWIKVLVISIAFYLLNPAVGWGVNTRALDMSFVTRLSFLAEATTKSLSPPFFLISLIHYLNPGRSTLPFPWVVIVGAILFLIGTAVAVFSFFRFKHSYFTWGWIWFYTYVWYIPWLGELHSKPDDNLGYYVNFAGYEFAYLSLVGLYVAIAILLSKQIVKKGFIGTVFAVLTVGILVYRLSDFIRLDNNWRGEYTNQTRSWYQQVFTNFAVPTGIHQGLDKNPKALVELDSEYIRQEARLFMPIVYYDGSVLFYTNAKDLYEEAILKRRIPVDRVYAIRWNCSQRKMLDLTPSLRALLINSQNINGKAPDFSNLEISSCPKL